MSKQVLLKLNSPSKGQVGELKMESTFELSDQGVPYALHDLRQQQPDLLDNSWDFVVLQESGSSTLDVPTFEVNRPRAVVRSEMRKAELWTYRDRLYSPEKEIELVSQLEGDKKSLSDHRSVLKYETFSRMLQGLNDVIMDTDRTPSDGRAVLTLVEKDFLKSHGMGYITHIFSLVDSASPPNSKKRQHAQRALACLTAKEVDLAKLIISSFTSVIRSNRNINQHPRPSRSEAISQLEGTPLDIPFAREFILLSPKRIRLPTDTNDLDLFGDTADSRTLAIEQRIQFVEDRLNDLRSQRSINKALLLKRHLEEYSENGESDQDAPLLKRLKPLST